MINKDVKLIIEDINSKRTFLLEECNTKMSTNLNDAINNIHDENGKDGIKAIVSKIADKLPKELLEIQIAEDTAPLSPASDVSTMEKTPTFKIGSINTDIKNILQLIKNLNEEYFTVIRYLDNKINKTNYNGLIKSLKSLKDRLERCNLKGSNLYGIIIDSLNRITDRNVKNLLEKKGPESIKQVYTTIIRNLKNSSLITQVNSLMNERMLWPMIAQASTKEMTYVKAIGIQMLSLIKKGQLDPELSNAGQKLSNIDKYTGDIGEIMDTLPKKRLSDKISNEFIAHIRGMIPLYIFHVRIMQMLQNKNINYNRGIISLNNCIHFMASSDKRGAQLVLGELKALKNVFWM